MKRTHKGELRDLLAKNMRLRRAELALSQEALALESGINRTYLSSVERSERNISIDNIERIAVALKAQPWELLRNSEARADQSAIQNIQRISPSKVDSK